MGTRTLVNRDQAGKLCVLPIQGVDLFEETLRIKRILYSSCKNFDDLLEGGLFTQELIEIFGPPGVGKTQMAISITSNVICKMELNVVYYDTCCSFAAERITQILQSNMDSLSPQTIKVTLSRLRCYRIFNVFDLLAELEALKQRLASEHNSFCLNVKVVILDCITSLITPILGGKKQYGHSVMLKVCQLLKEIAYDYGIAVLVLNNAVANFEENASKFGRLKPSMGKVWLSVPHVRLFLDFKKKESSERLLRILKHPRLPTGLATSVYIDKNGFSSIKD